MDWIIYMVIQSNIKIISLKFLRNFEDIFKYHSYFIDSLIMVIATISIIIIIIMIIVAIIATIKSIITIRIAIIMKKKMEFLEYF